MLSSLASQILMYGLPVLASSAAAHARPLAGRGTPMSCSTSNDGYLTGSLVVRPIGLNTNDGQTTGDTTYVGTVPGVTHNGIDGEAASILVTKNSDGTPVAPQEWEFVPCTDDTGPPPPGYVAPSDGPSNLSYGIVRPKGASQHCLTIESNSDTSAGDRNSILDSNCTSVGEVFRSWVLQNYIYGTSDYGQFLFFQADNLTSVVSNTAHAELQFVTNATTASLAGRQAMQLILVPWTSVEK
ncbi:hypothetical protein BCV69DRAFT_295265 [Microstroma glucosiphilum]|uniref:Uncharacterized protein n=1 Tax=Pseudomicrostroma glucosiphilum TaxID=1684307 RepID=A0A316TYL5_9BASI|nr:hypothetical protein BCV69DRAFT_295265 [Pseudomicrostroma glucosiphilum]PWN18379.1 hypothetical protein BCV69DRAFT_295265 [Pseudomicrostroma glucosiphilum]